MSEDKPAQTHEQRIDRLGLEYVDACKQFEIARIRVSDARLAIQAAQQERIIELEAQVKQLREAALAVLNASNDTTDYLLRDEMIALWEALGKPDVGPRAWTGWKASNDE